VRKLLQVACDDAGSQIAWARQHGLTGAYVSDVLQAKRAPGVSILEALGVEREITYRKKRRSAPSP
jgi:hypothetical protein